VILTVTPNIALDRTYVVPHLEVGAVHKVSSVFAQIGGKGVNVSRVLACMGSQTLVTGLLGGAGLDEATRDLASGGLESDLFAVEGSPRQTVVVTADDGTTTAFDEPGPTVTNAEWKSFEHHVRGLLERATLVVVSGSLPPGAPEAALRQLVDAAREHAVPIILDARGAALRAALGGRPRVAKLNRSELSETLARPCDSDDEVVQGARELREMGARTVIVTLGADGAIGLDGDEAWRVSHPAETGNPIGAGDAFSAGVAGMLADAQPFCAALREGAAAAIASLHAPTAGYLELSDLKAAGSLVEIELLGKETAPS
jgi:tagatose 6-phosphate kinase